MDQTWQGWPLGGCLSEFILPHPASKMAIIAKIENFAKKKLLKIFSFETTLPVGIKGWWNGPWMILFRITGISDDPAPLPRWQPLTDLVLI